MQVTVKGRHMGVTEPIREYANDKIGRLSKIVDQETMTAEVVLHVEKNPSIANKDVAEITVHMKRAVVRAEESAPDMYAAIDLAAEKLERQLRKYKTRLVDRRSAKSPVVKTAAGDIQIPTPVEEDEVGIIRTKVVDAKPMSEEEAILQLELLGHDFFVFTHAETDAINVLYRRNDGNYGLIQTQA